MGAIKVALYDTREGSSTKGKLMEFLMGDDHPSCLKIPPGVAHGCRALERSHISTYFQRLRADDEGRIPHEIRRLGTTGRRPNYQ